jgi:hypothetical protein
MAGVGKAVATGSANVTAVAANDTAKRFIQVLLRLTTS